MKCDWKRAACPSLDSDRALRMNHVTPLGMARDNMGIYGPSKGFTGYTGAAGTNFALPSTA
jgi:hypothetical protein